MRLWCKLVALVVTLLWLLPLLLLLVVTVVVVVAASAVRTRRMEDSSVAPSSLICVSSPWRWAEGEGEGICDADADDDDDGSSARVRVWAADICRVSVAAGSVMVIVCLAARREDAVRSWFSRGEFREESRCMPLSVKFEHHDTSRERSSFEPLAINPIAASVIEHDFKSIISNLGQPDTNAAMPVSVMPLHHWRWISSRSAKNAILNILLSVTRLFANWSIRNDEQRLFGFILQGFEDLSPIGEDPAAASSVTIKVFRLLHLGERVLLGGAVKLGKVRKASSVTSSTNDKFRWHSWPCSNSCCMALNSNLLHWDKIYE